MSDLLFLYFRNIADSVVGNWVNRVTTVVQKQVTDEVIVLVVDCTEQNDIHMQNEMVLRHIKRWGHQREEGAATMQLSEALR